MRHLLSIADLTAEELREILNLSDPSARTGMLAT